MAFNNTIIERAAVGIWGIKLGQPSMQSALDQIAVSSMGATVNSAFNNSYGAITNAAIAAIVVNNLGLTGTAVADGTAYIVAELGKVPAAARGEALLNIINLFATLGSNATYGAAATAFNSKVSAAVAYSSTAGTTDAVVGAIDTGLSFNLGLGQDNMTGTAGVDLFNAYIINNSNSLQSADFIDGGAGVDTLYADMGSSANFAVTPIIRNVETIQIRAQSRANDSGDNNIVQTNGAVPTNNRVDLDFERVSGVTRIESNNSRADVLVEDVRILPAQITKDITIAFVQSDPGYVDYGVYFDIPSLRADRTSSSSLVLQVIDIKGAISTNGVSPLLDAPYDGLSFTLNGQLVAITGNNAINNALNYPQLLSAIQAALAANPLTVGVTAALGATFTVNDSQTLQAVTGTSIVLSATNAVFGIGNWIATAGIPALSNLYTQQIAGSATVDDLVTSTIVLDNVGRGGIGGDLVVGALATGISDNTAGVARFEITVEGTSRLQNIDSTNNTLREVTIRNGTASGNLFVNGNSVAAAANAAPPAGPGILIDDPIPGAIGQHNTWGFDDVRLIDASALRGTLSMRAQVTAASLAKYVITNDTADNPKGDNVSVPSKTTQVADFIYTGGVNNDTMTVSIDAGIVASRSTILSGREDFSFVVNGGAGNDTITVTIANVPSNITVGGGQPGLYQNWYNNQKLNANVTINGGDGNDTIRKTGAGDAIINGGTGTDTIYADNTGSQSVRGGPDSTAGAAYAAATAAELALSLSTRTLNDATSVGITTAAATNLNNLNLVTPITFADPALPSKATILGAINTAVTNQSLTLAQAVALIGPSGYNIRTGDTISVPTTLVAPAIVAGATVGTPLVQAEFDAGNTTLAGYIATAKAASAQATAAASNAPTQAALLNATQLAVQNATIAVNGSAGTATDLADLTALKGSLVVGATDATVVAAIQLAVLNGVIAGGQPAALFAAAVASAGTMDQSERDATLLILDPLVNTATNLNVAANLTLTNAITANNTAIRAAAAEAGVEPVVANSIFPLLTATQAANIPGDALGSIESAAAATAARTALNTFNNVTVISGQTGFTGLTTQQSDLSALKAALAVGVSDLNFSLLTANAVNKGTITGGNKTALDAAATFAGTPTVGGTLDATEKIAVDLLMTALQLTNETLVDANRLVQANLTATRDATELAAANAAAAALVFGNPTGAAIASPLDAAASTSRGVWVLNTSDQTPVSTTPGTNYVLAVDDDRNLFDLRSDTDNVYNLYAARLTVNFKGIENIVTIPSTAYRTTDLQINQAIKNAVNNNVILNKLIVANDGPANTLVITSLIDGTMSEDNFSITVTAPVPGGISPSDIAAAAAVYGVAANEATVLAAMLAAKAAFDTKGDYVDRLAETGSFNGNALITGAPSITTSDNTITPGDGNDVIVLGTTTGLIDLLSSNDIVAYGANFGLDTIVNFKAGARATGGDVLNFAGIGGNLLTTAFNVDKSVSVVTEAAVTNGTAALVAALFVDSATVQTHVYVAVNTTTNIANVYTVTDAAGVGAGSVTAVLAGTIDLADTIWATLTSENFGSGL